MFRSLRGLLPSHLLVAGTVSALPLVHSVLVYRYFVVPQQALLIVVAGGLISVGVAGSFAWLAQESRAVKAALGAMLGLVVWLTVTAAAGLDPLRSFLGEDSQGTGLFVWWIAFGLFALALRGRRVLVQPVTGALVWVSWILIAGAAMWATGDSTVESSFVPVSEGGVPLPGVGNPAFLAAVLGTGVVTFFYRAVVSERRWMMWLLPLGAISVYLVACQSRVSTAATVGALVVLIAACWRSGADRVRVAGLLVAVIVGGGVGQLWAAPSVIERSEVRRAKAEQREAERPEDSALRFAGYQVHSGLQVRKVIWGSAAELVIDHPLTGVGAANLAYLFPRYLSEDEARETGLGRFHVDDSHNIVLEASVAGGIPAGLLTLIALAAVGFAIVRPDRSDQVDKKKAKTAVDQRDPILRLVIALVAGILLAEQLFQPVSLAITPLLFIALALAVPIPVSDEPVRRPAWAWVPATLTISIGVVLAGTLLYSERLLSRGSVEWDRNDLATAANLNPSCQLCRYELGKIRRWDFTRDRVGDARWAMEPNLRATRDHPSDDEALVQLAGGYLFLKQPQRAVEPLLRATKLNPYAALPLRGLGVAYLRLGEPRRAIPYIERLVSIDPSAASYDLLASAATEAGLTLVADEARSKAKALAPVENGTGATRR